MQFKVIDCSYEHHAQAILDIFNDVIETSTALYDYEKRTLESMLNWFEVKTTHRYPVIGLEAESGELMAFASYGSFRNWPAYKYSVEHSIYVHQDFRGLGLGHVLLGKLIELAKTNQFHAMIGGIDADNKSSIALHEKYGFRHVGTMPEVGYKFYRWLDLAFYQLLLSTPNHPSIP